MLGGDDLPIAAMLFRVPDEVEGITDHLRDHGWRTLEPPIDGPLSPVRGVGVEFRGDQNLLVYDVRGMNARTSLIADRLTDLPAGWARAAADSGYVLLLLDEGGAVPGATPVTGAYALLRGTRHAA